MQKDLNDETPKWLEELQQRSWEPEVLLSGIVLYGMFKTPALLDDLLAFFKANISDSSDFDNVVAILKLGTYWLIVGLILHLISRGIWVGMIGLSYIFPSGINHQRLKFNGKFQDKAEKLPSFQKIVINLEKICSSLFSISFMLFMSVVGAYAFIFVLIVVPFLLILWIDVTWITTNQLPYQIYVIAVLVLAIFGLLDFVTLGFFRRFKWIARIYWPLHRVISVLTLGRFYRPIYYAFISNFNRWVIGILLLIFVVLSISLIDAFKFQGTFGESFTRLSFWHSITGMSAFAGYYDDQNQDFFSVQAQIQSDIIDENVIRLFVPAKVVLEDSIRSYVKYDSVKKNMPESKRAEIDLTFIEKFYHIYLDDTLKMDVKFFYHYKTKTNQRGYLGFIDITNLPKGVHSLTVQGPPEMYKRKWAVIPFYRELNFTEDTNKIKPSEEVDDYLLTKPFLPK